MYNNEAQKMFEIPLHNVKKKDTKIQVGIYLYTKDRQQLDIKLDADGITLTDFVRSCIAAYMADLFAIK